MTSKASVYVVLAVAFGYLLVSSVPVRFETMTTKEVMQTAESNRSSSLSGEGFQVKGSEDIVSIPGVTNGGAVDWSTSLGFLVADLSIALVVYFTVKRRLS